MQEMQYPNGELNREFFTAEQVKNGGMQRRREALQSAGLTFVRAVRIGRNDPCPCGSGTKFKKCHIGMSDADLAKLQPARETTTANNGETK